jgi:predicted outer membrane protein
MTGVRKFGGAVGVALALTAALCWAQQQTATPGNIKPAQANSPAANPTGNNQSVQETQMPGQRPILNQPMTREANYPPSEANQEAQLDRVLAACLLTNNKGEVELAKLAEQRASDSDVQEFAQTMVKEHGEQIATLERFLGNDTPADQRSQIDKEVAERCAQDLKKELESKTGKEFDSAYIGSQIGEHLHMAAALAVISNHATGQFASIVKEAQPVVDKHLDQARKLMDQMDRPSSRQASTEHSDRER